MLGKCQIDHFEREGYVTEPRFFTAAEVVDFRAELDRLRQIGLLRNVATDGDGVSHSQSKANLQICPISPYSGIFRALHHDPRVIGTVSRLIGEPVYFRLDQIFLKPARCGQGTSWHQDWAYFRIPDPTKGVGMWIALHDATVANGTMHVVPRSHGELRKHYRDPSSDHHIRTDVDESQAAAIELPAGGALFFNYGICHCTRANLADHDRAGLALHFVNGDHAPAEFLKDCEPCAQSANGLRTSTG